MPIPANIAARVLELIAWRARYRSALLERLRQPGTLRLIWYAEADDWPEAPELWRPAQSVIAAVLAEQPERVQLVLYDLRACQAWQRAHGRPDDIASRADWAAAVAPPTYAIPPPPATHSLRVQIPDGLEFSALQLARDPVTLDVSFDLAPIEAICAASGIDPALFGQQHEDNVAGLIQQWYRAHLAAGGKPDPVQEQIMAEVEAEGAAGGQAGVISHRGDVH